jgi:formate-dependent nitrite reductase membrane component NrfD
MTRALDLRRIIAYLFFVYGIILTITGALDGHAAIVKAQGVRINLWVGLGMIGIGLIFLIWELAKPLPVSQPSPSSPSSSSSSTED